MSTSRRGMRRRLPVGNAWRISARTRPRGTNDELGFYGGEGEDDGGYEYLDDEEKAALEEAETEAMMVITGANRTLAEARKQIASARLRRDSYWPQGK